jgi:hypothetical protein
MEKEFLLEKYKYVLEQKRSLNEATFKILSVYQVVIVGLVYAQYVILNQLFEKKISKIVAEVGSNALLFSSIFLSIFCAMMIAVGIASWIEYKKDEARIESGTDEPGESSIKLKDFFRWYETYFLLLILAIQIGLVIGSRWFIMPIVLSAP